jgi:hypothetical protein
MVSLSIALALAAALTLAAVEFDAYLVQSLVRFLVGGSVVTAGLVSLWAVVKEWRTKNKLRLRRVAPYTSQQAGSAPAPSLPRKPRCALTAPGLLHFGWPQSQSPILHYRNGKFILELGIFPGPMGTCVFPVRWGMVALQ